MILPIQSRDEIKRKLVRVLKWVSCDISSRYGNPIIGSGFLHSNTNYILKQSNYKELQEVLHVCPRERRYGPGLRALIQLIIYRKYVCTCT